MATKPRPAPLASNCAGCRAPKVYAGAQCVSLVADRMRVDHRFNAGGFHVCHRRLVNLKAFCTGLDVSEQSILKTIRIGECFLRETGSSGVRLNGRPMSALALRTHAPRTFGLPHRATQSARDWKVCWVRHGHRSSVPTRRIAAACARYPSAGSRALSAG